MLARPVSNSSPIILSMLAKTPMTFAMYALGLYTLQVTFVESPLDLLSFTKVRDARILKLVIPAQAGIHWLLTAAKWIPAFAGMTWVLRSGHSFR
jgi:hypothetical protein